MHHYLVNTLDHSKGVTSVAFSPNGTSFASGSDDGTVRIWDLNEQELNTTLMGFTNSKISLAYSKDGSILANGSIDGDIQLLHSATGHPIVSLSAHPIRVASLTFSPDGGTIVSCGGFQDNQIRVWDTESQQLKSTIIGDSFSVFSVTFSPDGNTFASGGEDKILRIWDAKTLQPITALPGHSARILSVAYSDDGNTIATGSRDNTVRLWDVETKQNIATFKGHTDRVYSVAVSPDGRTIASGSRDSTVRLWDTKSAELKAVLTVHTYSVRSVAFSSDSNTIASGGEDGIVRLWEAETGYSIGDLFGHTASVRSVVFSPDNRTLASASQDGTIILWDIERFRSNVQPLQQAISNIQQENRYKTKLRIIYFRPNDRFPQQDISAKIARIMENVQLFFAREMYENGYSIKTFTYETDEKDDLIVHQVVGNQDETYYRDQTYSKVIEEIDQQFPVSDHIAVIFLEMSGIIFGHNICGLGGVHPSGGGVAMFPALNGCFSFRIVAHELGHALGLFHDFSEPNLMSASSGYLAKISKCAAVYLSVHPSFNLYPNTNDVPSNIQPFPPIHNQFNTVCFRFEIADSNGLNQAQLIIPATADDPIKGTKVLGCKRLIGETEMVEFIVAESSVTLGTSVGIQVVDMFGNVVQEWQKIEENTILDLDVNGDDIVNILDLVEVASNFGETDNLNRADINRDGVVNIQDLVLVVNGIK